MLEFLGAPFLVLHFSYYTLMTFLTMLSVILLFMLMILLPIASVIRHLICGNNNLNWLLNLNLIYETLWTGVRSGLLISMLGKLSWFHLTGLITVVLLMWKWMGLFLRENNLLSCCSWASLLNWIGVLTLSLLLKIGALICSMKFLSPEIALYLYKSTICPCMEHWCHICTGVPQLLLGIVRQATKTNMQECWPFTCCFSWTLGSLLECGQLKSFL